MLDCIPKDQPAQQRQPNMLFILADNIGYGMAAKSTPQCMGRGIKTVDRLSDLWDVAAGCW
jgi:hypothetical protein